ncbi:MAG: Fic family protein [Sphaerochaetaceae bacterium]|mgnify:CR=1 FL=1|nr:Fic family protein [Sphaerochaetaceae bacterium]
MHYIWQNTLWPNFVYDKQSVNDALKVYNSKKDYILSLLSFVGDSFYLDINARRITDNIVNDLLIENEKINVDSVLSSVSKHLNLEFRVSLKSDKHAQSITEMVFDAIENKETLTAERLCLWNKKLFTYAVGLKPKKIGAFREGREFIIHKEGKNQEILYEAVPVNEVEGQVKNLLSYINTKTEEPELVKASIASLYFVLIHPFEDGNGRIARAIFDYCSANKAYPFCTMSSMILKKRKEYYSILESISTSDSMDVTKWIVWCIDTAIEAYNDMTVDIFSTIRLSRFMASLDPSEFNSREISMLYKLSSGSFFGKLTTDKWAKMNKCSTAAALRDIGHLVDKGFLISDEESGPKHGYFLKPDLSV